VEIGLILGVSAAAILFAIFLENNVLRSGTADIQRVSNAIKEGAEAFLARQNKIIGTSAIVAGALTFEIYS
jgi:K(+)-stimulated pyrophosphate-energized sodium pump